MPYTPLHTTGAADPRRFRVGNRIRFIDAPILAQFVPSGTTATVTARIGYRAFEVECDGHALAIIDFPENMRKCGAQEAPSPYALPAKFVSRKKCT